MKKDTCTYTDFVGNFIAWATLLNEEEIEALKNICDHYKIEFEMKRWKHEK